MRNMLLKKYVLCLMVSILSYGCTSSEDNDFNGSNANVADALKTACRDWGADMSAVESHMKGYTQLSSEYDFLMYTSPKNDVTISYSFTDDGLCSTAVIYEGEGDKVSLKNYMSDFSYIGNISGTKVYSDNLNTIGVVFDEVRADLNRQYSIIGFAPIESNSFEEVTPVSVTTCDVISVSATEATVGGVLNGVNTSYTCGIEYSISPDFTDCKQKSKYSSGEFEVSISGLSVNTKYYYRAYAVVESVYYYGEILSFQTEDVPTYSIGDLYPNATNPIGIVWKVSEQGLHGKIVSLDQASKQWDVNSLTCENASAYNKSDGSANKMPSGQPYQSWVSSHGTGWYGPALNELVGLNSVLSSINTALRSNGYSAIDGFYWSSTQHSSTTAYMVCVSQSGYMGYSGGWSGYNSKNVYRSVIAMKQF
ncbi:MAG: hypothetical protein NC127_05400 [Muribaculum sp.]|nr:hypothetical protein [Muribaculum sp.]